MAGIHSTNIEKRKIRESRTPWIEERVKGLAFVTSKLMETIEDKNFNAISFYLRNRAPDQWADRQEVNHNLDLKGVLTDARERINIIEHAPTHALKNSARTPRASDSEGEGANE